MRLAFAFMFLPLACTFDGLDGYSSGADAGTKDVSADDKTIDAISEDVVAPPLDTGSDAPPPPCNLSAPFGTPTPVTALNTTLIDTQAALSPDQLTVYFASNRLGSGENIFTASRASTAASFGSVAPLTSLNFSTADTWDVALTGNGLTAYLVTDQGGSDHLYKATRASSLVAFNSPSLMPSPVVDGEQPFVTPSGSALYYSDAKLGPKSLIVRADLGGTITTATQTLNVGSHDVGIPVVDPTETRIYFAVFDAATFDSYDIWTASRAKTTDPWSTPVIVSELDTAAFEAPSWLSADECEIYFTRVISGTNWDIYVARKP